MKIIIETDSETAANNLRSRIVKDITDLKHETWRFHSRYDETGEDLIFHETAQFPDDDYPEKNVIFGVCPDKKNVIFKTGYWEENPEPSQEMFALHTGRLVELLIGHYTKKLRIE